jgi:hypothetical protein
MVLDGMEQSLGTVFWSNKNGVLNKSNLNKNCINLVRYADDCAPRKWYQEAVATS